jgi:hypothetical protein
MKLIRPTTWPETFENWSSKEASDPSWIHCATQIKGWPDWHSWRNFTAEQFDAQNLDWNLYEFDNPMKEIPEMLMGPFQGWQNRMPTQNTATFNDLIDLPSQMKYWSSVEKIISLIENFPQGTQLIGLIREDIDKIICLEGHHRATALTIADRMGQTISLKNPPLIALAKITGDIDKKLTEILERGTSKTP